MAHFKNIIIGSGQAGIPLAHFLAGRGEKTLIVEKERVGGTCVNTGCTPSKTMYEALRGIHNSKNLKYAGYKIRESDFEFEVLLDYIRNQREEWSSGSASQIQQTRNLKLQEGHARFLDSHTVWVNQCSGGQQEFSADRIFINTGARPAIPDITGLDQVPFFTTRNIFEINNKPQSLAIIGGGYIGVEFAQMFQRAGTQVHLIHHSEKLVNHEDDDIIQLLQNRLESEGVNIHLNADTTKVEKSNSKIHLTLQNGKSVTAEQLLICTGRVPNSDKLGLENTAIQLKDSGHINVDPFLKTAEDHIYAMGEVAGSPQFTHMAYDDFRIVRAQLTGEKYHSTQERILPYTLFTDPELGRFGLNEKQARDANIKYKLYEMPMEKVARAIERRETYGKIKVLCNSDSGEIIGASVLGTGGGDLMTTLQIAAAGGLRANDLQNFIFAHPLLAESFNNLFTS